MDKAPFRETYSMITVQFPSINFKREEEVVFQQVLNVALRIDDLYTIIFSFRYHYTHFHLFMNDFLIFLLQMFDSIKSKVIIMIFDFINWYFNSIRYFLHYFRNWFIYLSLNKKV